MQFLSCENAFKRDLRVQERWKEPLVFLSTSQLIKKKKNLKKYSQTSQCGTLESEGLVRLTSV